MLRLLVVVGLVLGVLAACDGVAEPPPDATPTPTSSVVLTNQDWPVVHADPGAAVGIRKADDLNLRDGRHATDVGMREVPAVVLAALFVPGAGYSAKPDHSGSRHGRVPFPRRRGAEYDARRRHLHLCAVEGQP